MLDTTTVAKKLRNKTQYFLNKQINKKFNSKLLLRN